MTLLFLTQARNTAFSFVVLSTWKALVPVTYMAFSHFLHVLLKHHQSSHLNCPQLSFLNTFWAAPSFSGGGGVHPVQRGTLSSVPGVYLLDAHSIPLFSYDQQLSLGGQNWAHWEKKRPITNLLLPIHLFKM